MRLPLRLVGKNLFKRPLRTVLTIGSLTVALFLLCTLRSLVVTIEAGVKAARSDRIIVQSAVSLFVNLPESYEAKIRRVEGVEETCRWNWFGGYFKEPANFFAQFAVDVSTLVPVYPEIVLSDAERTAFASDQRGCIVGYELAEQFGWKIGDTVPIISALFPRKDGSAWEFILHGTYRSKTSNVDNRTLFFHDEYLEKSLEDGAAEGPVGVGVFAVDLEPGAEPVAVMRRIDELFENDAQRVQSTSEAEFQAQFVSMVGNVPFFVAAIGTGVLVAIVLAVINTMLMAAREQARDAGILRALGFPRRSVFGVFLFQSLLLSVGGGGAGVVLALAASGAIAALVGTAFPGYHVTTETAAAGIGISVAIGVFAGLFPAWTLSRRPPVESLRLEV
jgi:putative ABC transport system permease protein